MDKVNPFYDNGKPRFKGSYRKGQMHGFWEFYRKDGSLMRSGTFNDGIQIGSWKTFDRNGDLVKETNFD
ncbi:MAG: toxin-antitoxin system YwqK family antitoxin [Rhodoluna sp.]